MGHTSRRLIASALRKRSKAVLTRRQPHQRTDLRDSTGETVPHNARCRTHTLGVKAGDSDWRLGPATGTLTVTEDCRLKTVDCVTGNDLAELKAQAVVLNLLSCRRFVYDPRATFCDPVIRRRSAKTGRESMPVMTRWRCGATSRGVPGSHYPFRVRNA